VKGNFHARFLGGRGRVNRLRLPGAASTRMANSSAHQKRSRGFPIWISLGVLVVFILFVRIHNSDWHKSWVESRAQRNFVFSNVEAAGGWNTFRSECDALINYSRTSGQDVWFSLRGDKLPDSFRLLRSLNPGEVRVLVLDSKPTCVEIQVFGLHRTKSRDTPWYYLFYQQDANYDHGYAGGSFAYMSLEPRKITNSIFEIY
jgi:hypothetical protein